MKRLAFFAALTLIACGGSSTSPTTTLNTTATVTLSGAQTGTFTSNSVGAVFVNSNQLGAITFLVAQAGTAPGITVAITFSGEPKVGHFKNTDVGAQGGAGVTLAQSQIWLANIAGTGSAVGSYDLNLTSVSTNATVSTGKVYNVSGTLDAVLPAVAGSGATGTVTLHAVF
jgi:hypothetical protein